MNNLIRLFGVAIVAGGISFFVGYYAGCPSTPEEHFRRNHPIRSRHFTEFRPTSLGVIASRNYQEYQSNMSLLNHLKRMVRGDEAVVAYIERIQGELEKQQTMNAKFVKDFSKRLRENDRLFEYEYADGTIEETGLLVLRAGNIVERHVFVSKKTGQQGASPHSPIESGVAAESWEDLAASTD